MGEHEKAEEVKELLLLIADGADLGVWFENLRINFKIFKSTHFQINSSGYCTQPVSHQARQFFGLPIIC